MCFAAFWRAICGLLQRRLRPFAKLLHRKALAAGHWPLSATLHLAAYPLHYHGHDVALLLSRQHASRRYAVPFGQASAATTARGVLRYEHRMAAHGRLPPVVRRHGGREASAHEVASVAAMPLALTYSTSFGFRRNLLRNADRDNLLNRSPKSYCACFSTLAAQPKSSLANKSPSTARP